MIEKIEFRDSRPGDASTIETLYQDAFPDEDLLPLVRDLLTEGSNVISLVGIVDTVLVGHIVFTTCGIVDSTAEVAFKLALLGPLAVTPAKQRQGIGKALIRAGLQRLEKDGTSEVFVLGDPVYYGRFGFQADHNVAPPYPLPDEWDGAWQSLSLHRHETPACGKLSVPRPWRQPALWAP